MGVSLGTGILAGAIQGFGQGVAQIGQFGMQEESDKRKQDALMMREKALAQFKSDLDAPDKKRQLDIAQQNADTTQDFRQDSADNTAEHNANQAAHYTATEEINRLKAENAGLKSGATKPDHKLDQTMTDFEKLKMGAILKQEEELPTKFPDPTERAKAAMDLKRTKLTEFGDPEMSMTPKGEVVFRNRFGDTQRFKSPEEAAAAGFGSPKLTAMADEVNAYLAKQGSDAKQKQATEKSGRDQASATDKFNKSGNADKSLRELTDAAGTPTAPPAGSIASAMTGGYVPPPDSPAGQHAARLARQQAEAQGKATGAANVRAMVQQNAASYTPEQAQQILDAYGSMLTPAELNLLQQRIRTAR